MKFPKPNHGAQAALALLLASPIALADAAADDGADELDVVVVTATRLPVAPTGLATSSTRIDDVELEQHYPASIVDAMRHVAGVNIGQNGGRGGATSVLIRGGEANFTAVFIDGVRVNDLTNTSGGSYEFSGLDLAGVSRIDLVRGPLSSIYGSDALAGVIHVITDSPRDGASLELDAGTDGLARAAVSAGGELAGTHIAVGAHALRDDSGDSQTAYEDSGAHASLRRDFADGSRLRLGARWQQAEVQRFPQESGGALLAAIREQERVDNDEAHLRLAWDTVIGDAWNVRLAGSYYERNETIDSPGIAPGLIDGVPPSMTDTGFDRRQVIATAQREIDGVASFVLGAEWQDEKGTSRGTLDLGFPLPTDFTLQRDSLGVFAESSVPLGALTLQASLRQDDIDAVGAETTLRAGALYRFEDGRSELRINSGAGFKAPSFFALAHPLIGNPDLRPESADSIDAEFLRHFAERRGRFSLAVYRNEFTDLVDFDPALFQLVNRSRVVTEGVELALRFPVGGDVDVQAHVTHARSDIRGSDAELRGRPRWRGGISVDWTPSDAWTLSARALIVDAFFDSSIVTGTLLLDGYERLDVTATWRAGERITWRFALDNAFDADYVEAVGFPAQGLRARIGVRLAL